MDAGCSRRQFLQAMGLGTVSLSVSGCTSRGPLSSTDRSPVDPSKHAQPNILFIMIDDLGPEWISCYGGEEMETPHIDALARGGMLFTHAYSMPKCTPTRATLLTGQYPYRTGWINHWDVPRWGCGCHFDWNHYTTFGHVMKRAGYATAAAGKWQINDFRVQPDAMAKCGFDDYCMWTGFETGVGQSARRFWDPYIHTKEGSKTYKGRFGEDVFADFLIDFMQRNKNGPMMMYYPMCLTHTPLTTTPLEPKVEGKMETFKAMVRYTDHTVGRLIQALDELRIRENTIVILTSDNGTGGAFTARMSGRKVKGGKGKLTESGMRAPFIVNGPGLVPSGVVTDALTDFTDMLPTFAALGNASLPENTVLDGSSLADVILGRTKDGSRDWIMAMGGGVARFTGERVVPSVSHADRVLRDKRFKLWIVEGKSAKLFDLQTDPAEQFNLIDSTDPLFTAARKKLEYAATTFPDEDGAPRYEPLPPQPWDKGSKKKQK